MHNTGASGVGCIAIQLAKRVFGIGTVVASASRENSRRFALHVGADVIVDARKGIREELVQQNIIKVDYVRMLYTVLIV